MNVVHAAPFSLLLLCNVKRYSKQGTDCLSHRLVVVYMYDWLFSHYIGGVN